MKPTESMINAYRRGAAELTPEDEKLIDRREKLLGPAYRLFYERPVHFVRGEGVWLYDKGGTAYLDAYNNVASLGHCHPRVVEAVRRQFGILSTHTRYISEDILTYAESLLSSFSGSLDHVMFTCTGSEANDLAMRIAAVVTGATGVIVTENAYHGVTKTVAAMSPSLGSGNPIGPDVWCVPAPRSGPDAGRLFAEGVSRALAEMKAAGIRPAAMMVDSIFSSDGVFVDPCGFLREAIALIQAQGALFVADEVQPGFGRTGDFMWGFQRHAIHPDLVTMGKPMGNGYPVAGLVARSELLSEFGGRTRYFNTFGGNSTAIAAAQAVWDVINEEGLLANAKEVGGYLVEGLSCIDDPCLGEIRGAGLFIGVDIRRDEVPWPEGGAKIVNRLRERNVLISATGKAGAALKIRPPLIFTKEHANLFLETLSVVVKEVASER